MNTQDIMSLADEYWASGVGEPASGARVALQSAVEALVADLIACRGSVKSDYQHWNLVAQRCGGTELGSMANEEMARLEALADRIDALTEQK